MQQLPQEPLAERLEQERLELLELETEARW
jgi:hypothetical protein